MAREQVQKRAPSLDPQRVSHCLRNRRVIQIGQRAFSSIRKPAASICPFTICRRKRTKRSPTPPVALAVSSMKKPRTVSRPIWLLPAGMIVKAVFACAALLSFAGCAATPNNDVLVDPLKQRLIAREDTALQNLLFARMPAYPDAGPGGGGHSYLDAPYDGPAIEPPLPDLSLLPEDLPPWEEKLEPLPPVPDGTPDPITTPPPAPAPAPEVTSTPQP